MNEYIFKPYDLKLEITKHSESTTNHLGPWQEFCTTTKMHGFNFLVDYSKPKWFRVAAAGVVLAGFLSFVWFCFNASKIFYAPSITTSLTVETPDSQPFPSIHICDGTYFSKRRLRGDFFDKLSCLQIQFHPSIQSTFISYHIILYRSLFITNMVCLRDGVQRYAWNVFNHRPIKAFNVREFPG